MDFLKLPLNATAHAALVILLAVLLVRYFLSPFASSRAGTRALLTRDSRPIHRLRPAPPLRTYILYVALMFVASRLMFLLMGGAMLHLSGRCDFLSYLQDLSAHWSRWDARHYIAIAEDWYVNTGDERLKLVFYPLYPILVGLINVIFRHTYLSAYIASNACLLGCGIVLYRISCREWGASTARRAVFFLMFAPLSFYFSVPYTESLFVLTTLLAVDFSMQRKWTLALLMGALSAFTRSLGLLTAVLIFYEMLIDWRPKQPLRPIRQLIQPPYLRHMGLRALLCCTVALGFAAYLLINYQVSGNPFQFLEYQANHWSQEFGSLWNTIGYSFANALHFQTEGYRTGVWIPQLLYLFSILVIMLLSMDRIRPSYGAYALLYTYMAYAPTWLLSGPRYMTAMATLYPMLALLSREKWALYLLGGLSITGCALMTHQFLMVGCVL